MPKINTTEGRLVRIETTLEYLKANSDETKNNLNKFIIAADNKYATKAEVSELRVANSKNSNRLFDLGIKVAYGAGIIAAIYLIAKGGI